MQRSYDFSNKNLQYQVTNLENTIRPLEEVVYHQNSSNTSQSKIVKEMKEMPNSTSDL